MRVPQTGFRDVPNGHQRVHYDVRVLLVLGLDQVQVPTEVAALVLLVLVVQLMELLVAAEKYSLTVLALQAARLAPQSFELVNKRAGIQSISQQLRSFPQHQVRALLYFAGSLHCARLTGHSHFQIRRKCSAMHQPMYT